MFLNANSCMEKKEILNLKGLLFFRTNADKNQMTIRTRLDVDCEKKLS